MVVNGFSSPFSGGATNSANLRTPAEESVSRGKVQSETAPSTVNAVVKSASGSVSDISSKQTVGSLLQPRANEVNNQTQTSSSTANSTSNTSQNQGAQSTGLAQTRTLNVVETQLQAARFQPSSSSSVSSNENLNSLGSTAATTSGTTQINIQKAFSTPQTASSGLGLSVNTRS